MFFPISFDNIECQPAACEIVNSRQALLQRLINCQQAKFSGHLSLSLSNPSQAWSLYFLDGQIINGMGGIYPVRRWYRQVVQHCLPLGLSLPPQPKSASATWSYPALMQQVSQGQLMPHQVTSAVTGNVTEILFDLLQAHENATKSQPRPEGNTLDIHMTYQDFCQEVNESPPILVAPSQVLKAVIQTWSAWQQAGLTSHSPNRAPVILDRGALRRRTPPAAYRSLTQLIDGELTLRDLSVRLKQTPRRLTRSLLPFIDQGTIGLASVSDWSYTPNAPAPPSRPIRLDPKGPLVAYIEDSRFDCMAMEKILEQTQYRYISIRDPLQALPMLLEHKPDVIYLDVLMPVLNGYEVCAQIRQISAFKNTPIIIVTSSDGIVDRVRANLVGASGFLGKPLTSEKTLASLATCLLASQNLSIDQEISSDTSSIRTLELGNRRLI